MEFSVSGNPSGSSLSDSVFTWTPGFGQSCTHTMNFTALDLKGGTVSETLSITVVEVNRSPVLTSIGNQTVAEGNTLTLSLFAKDPDGR